MRIGKPGDIPPDQITPWQTYINRRTFIRGGILLGTAAATGWIYRKLNAPPAPLAYTPTLPKVVASSVQSIGRALNISDAQTPYDQATTYNNYYEFSEDKGAVAGAAANFVAGPWTVDVGGLVSKPKKFDLGDLLKISPPEERVYRMRCVEAWSMVIPWDCFSLSKLLDRVRPLSAAKYVAFQTLYDPNRMPGQNDAVLQWPYVEGLRMDEAMHPLTILASGIYGRQLPPQDGAPIRLVVPWKYGFKGIKAIVKITLVAEQPPTTWNLANPPAYGFYANVNPDVARPWDQSTERRIDASGEHEIATQMFNGYADQVGWMYAGMDLSQNY
ncbi:MAG TPA: protein-methionine-sulfoxide reductase catalytic subunit MsrP [Tepidisphaeraceae bacterium]|nr:protein-methionine-sulfoxide reductase catalytic subunit MsrP [Tepidisphaeraceae bacterium]